MFGAHHKHDILHLNEGSEYLKELVLKEEEKGKFNKHIKTYYNFIFITINIIIIFIFISLLNYY